MKNQVISKVLYLFHSISIISIFLFSSILTQMEVKASEVPLEIESTEVLLEENVGGLHEEKINIVTFTQEDLKYLSSIIYCEAGNQCEAGKRAVGIVVLNRVEHEQFEDTIKGVIYQKGQFTPVSSGSINTALAMFDSHTLPVECISAAIYALEHNTTVVYNDKKYVIDHLYFCGSPKNADLQIEDHYFR